MSVAFTGLDDQAKILRAEIDRRVSAVLDHGRFIMGPEVAEFERELAAFCGASNAIAVANGTDALQIALMAGGVKAGEAVFLPAFTYTATAEVIMVLGAVPIFVDADATTFNMDCSHLELQIARARQMGIRPAAVIGVDLFGLPADWDKLTAICDRHGLFLIADSAQGFGGEYKGRKVGTLAPVTTTSFFPAKPLGCYGDGGALLTEDAELASIMRSIRVHGQGREKYETVRVGMNSRLDTLQAAILLAKIGVFADELKRRDALADSYAVRLGNAVDIPVVPVGLKSAWAQYTIKSNDRDRLQGRLTEKGIPTAVYYPKPLHQQTAYAVHGARSGPLPVSEALCSSVLSLPMNPYWTKETADAVCDAVLASLN
jgi:UDP-2-acetamido-2-deoxy-ribo-hexuluronate aminotransferase